MDGWRDISYALNFDKAMDARPMPLQEEALMAQFVELTLRTIATDLEKMARHLHEEDVAGEISITLSHTTRSFVVSHVVKKVFGLLRTQAAREFLGDYTMAGIHEERLQIMLVDGKTGHAFNPWSQAKEEMAAA